jgi:hypothetical protein
MPIAMLSPDWSKMRPMPSPTVMPSVDQIGRRFGGGTFLPLGVDDAVTIRM